MRVWIKNFGYHKNRGYQFFESEICTDKKAMETEEDFKTSTEFVSISELIEIKKQLSDLQEKYDRAVELIKSSEVQFEPCGKCLCKCACEEENE